MKIILDTNVIVADPAMNGVYFVLLDEHLSASGDELVVPQLVLQEAYRRFDEEVVRTVREIRTRAKCLDRLTGLKVTIPDDGKLTLDGYRRELIGTFEARLQRLGARFAETPDVPHSLLLDALFARRKPFAASNEKDHGYRDALIWCSVVREAVDGAEVAFVSSNSTDFPKGEEEGLHADLASWLPSGEAKSGRVHVFHGLAEFVKARVMPQYPEMVVKAQMTKGKYKGVMDRQEEEATNFAIDFIVDNYPLHDPGGYVETGASIWFPTTEVTQVRILPRGRLLANTRVRFDVDVDLVPNADYYSAGRHSVTPKESPLRRPASHASESINVAVVATMSMVIGEADGNVEAITVENMSFGSSDGTVVVWESDPASSDPTPG